MYVYLIQNLMNGKCYIGQTVRALSFRWGRHNWEARNGSQLPIHNALRKYGKDNFRIVAIDRATSREELNDLEKGYISLFGTISPNGYNLGAGGGCGPFHPDTIEKIRIGNTGKQLSLEQRIKIGNATRGLKRSEETKRKMSLSQKGRKPSEQCIQAGKEAAKHRKFTPERKAKLRERFSGDRNPSFRHDIANSAIQGLLDKGLRPPDIAAKLNCPYLMIYRRCRTLGFKYSPEEYTAYKREIMVKAWGRKKEAARA